MERLAVFLVLVLCQGARGSRPELSPGDPEIHLDEGQPLKLTCTSTDRMKFHYPDNSEHLFLLDSSPAFLKEDDIDNWQRRIIFRRPNTVPGDTGWYGCSSVEDNITSGNYDDPRVSWTYVYVKSNSSYFVQKLNNDEIEMLNAVLGIPVVIPCRPTSPDHKINLYVNGKVVEVGKSASYDPKMGFTLKKFTLKDNGYVTCSISEDYKADIRFFLNVRRPSKLIQPTIINDTLRHVVRGQTLYVNCTTVLNMDAQYSFNWTTPRQSSKITTRPFPEEIGVNKQLVTCELIIDGVTDEDAGDYTCTITSHDDSKSATTHIKVHDPAVKYINLTVDGDVHDYQKISGDNVQWVVHVDAYPNPTLRWLGPTGKVINASWSDQYWNRYSIETTYTTMLTTILRINEVGLTDMGLYSLEATNPEQTKTLNFTLEVRAKPMLMFGNLKDFYMPTQEVKILCNILAFPAPNISCSYTKAPNYPSMDGLHIVPLKVSVDPKASTAILSVISMTINGPESGDITCEACNTVGCDSAAVPIWVSDVPSGFDIIKPTTELTEGDDLNITCAASLYNYTHVVWEDENGELSEDSDDSITITKSQTKYTLRSELRIKNVKISRNGSIYNCVAHGSDHGNEMATYKLQIYDAEPPYFRETNMNKTEITFDLSAEEHPTVTLKCYVGGTPSPRLTWFKDEVIIERNEQYMFLHKNQELHIKYLLDGNSGRYTCKAENRHGELSNYQIFTIKGKEVSKAWIISIVVLLIICVILVIYFSIKMHREKVMRKQLMEAGLTHFEEGALECLNPELTVDDQAELLPYDRKWEFPRERLKFGKQLGFGAFGVVMKAEARGICEDEPVSTVAVKMVRRSTESTYIRALASELKIMVYLGKHLNVVNLLGACTKNITKRELLVIVEYCRFGNLHNYLLRHRADFINQIDPATGKLDSTIGLDILTRTTSVGSNNRIKYAALSFSRSLSANSHNSSAGAELVSYTAGTDPQSVSMSPDGCVLSNNSTQPGWRSNYSGDYKDQNLKPICTQDLLSWAFQVARGMEYLSQRKVLHGDLAARNILLAENNIVKICDFGLAKTMYNDANYKKMGDAPLPIKWMAIESIRDRIFSTQSDIWSFGIVLWEFFTLAKTPYPGMEAEKQYQRLIEGYRMEQPEYATKEVYDIMLQCWKAKPSLRPTFTNLVASIGDLLEESVKEHYVDLNAPYLNMNTTALEGGKNDYLTMMSAPDHDALSSPTVHYVNSPTLSPGGVQEDSYLPMSPSSPGCESGIFSPRVLPDSGKFQFPMNETKGNIHSDSESEAVELSPMLTQEEDNYLKPINVHERRAEFARQREAALKAAEMERANEGDSGYCNAPRNLRLIDLHAADAGESKVDGTKKEKDAPSIIRTQDNYVNMPRQKNSLRKDAPDSFSNPVYIMMGNRELEQPGA